MYTHRKPSGPKKQKTTFGQQKGDVRYTVISSDMKMTTNDIKPGNFCIINHDNKTVTLSYCKTLRGVVRWLVIDWSEGDIELDGICDFMRKQGIDSGLTDAEIDEDTDISDFADRIREWLKTADDSNVMAFLTVFESTIYVEHAPGRVDYDHPAVSNALDENYQLIIQHGVVD